MIPRKSDRPTMPPSFDVEQYAKESDARIAVVPRRETPEPLLEPAEPAVETPRSEMRLLTRPEMGATVTDDSWARSMVGAPVVVMEAAALKRLPLDHRAGFILSLMDGAIDLDTLAEIASMPRDEVVRIVRDLFESGVVDFR